MRTIYIAALVVVAASSTALASLASAMHHEKGTETAARDAIDKAVASPTRSDANIARDTYRHPAETLAFFEVEPGETVLELFPGSGWYSEILAPLLKDKGTLYAAAPAGKYHETIAKKFAADADTYSHVKVVTWPLEDGVVAPGSVDTILTFRNVHNLVMNDAAPAAFATFFSLLKPGGTLGIVDHRLPEDRDAVLEKSSGYLKVSTVRKLAEDAGFVLEAESGINANPKDTANWEKGVWTLPPVLRLGDTDRAKYLAIGESDRMTLRFRKPEA